VLTFACSAGYTTLGYQAQTIQITLSGSHRVGSPTYVGEPPAKIADLLDETETAAGAVGDAADGLTAGGCSDPMACPALLITLTGAIDKLSGKLDAWAV